MITEGDGADIRATQQNVSPGAEVEVVYVTRNGATKRRRGEVRSTGTRMEVVFPDGRSCTIGPGTVFDFGNNRLKRVIPVRRGDWLVSMLKHHKRVKSVEQRADGELSVVTVGNAATVRNLIESRGGEVTGSEHVSNDGSYGVSRADSLPVTRLEVQL